MNASRAATQRSRRSKRCHCRQPRERFRRSAPIRASSKCSYKCSYPRFGLFRSILINEIQSMLCHVAYVETQSRSLQNIRSLSAASSSVRCLRRTVAEVSRPADMWMVNADEDEIHAYGLAAGER